MPVETQALWTLVIEGSEELSFLVPGNPPVEHTGGSSIHHLVLRDGEAEEVTRLVEGQSLRVSLNRVLGQSPEQASERTRLLGQDRVWPCAQCPTCPWLDPLGEPDPCGLRAWPSESVAVLRETSEGHREAEAACPVIKGRGDAPCQ